MSQRPGNPTPQSSRLPQPSISGTQPPDGRLVADEFLTAGSGDFFAPLALLGLPAYAGNAVKQPFINVEEKIDRVVGKRTKTLDSLKAGMQLQSLGAELHRTFKHRWCPKGVYRFKTHEEADEWLWRMIARPTS